MIGYFSLFVIFRFLVAMMRSIGKRDELQVDAMCNLEIEFVVVCC